MRWAGGRAIAGGAIMTHYEINREITSGEFVDLLERSTLAQRRPVEDSGCVEGMLRHADLLITAWEDDRLVGAARSVTDFDYCCYLSDLAVDVAVQGRGVGRELIRRTREQLGPRCILILLSAPAAIGYYPRIGFTRHDSAWILKADDPLV
jgi:ribosomal protein S18 acetylase RimI-like enzyme